MVTATLDGTEGVSDMFGIGGEVEPPVLKIIWFEGDRTVKEIDEAMVEFATLYFLKQISLVHNEFDQILKWAEENVRNKQESSGSIAAYGYGYYLYCITGLIKQEAESHIEDDSSKKHHPQTDPDRELTTDICDNLFHQLSIINYFILNVFSYI